MLIVLVLTGRRIKVRPLEQAGNFPLIQFGEVETRLPGGEGHDVTVPGPQ